MACWSPGALSAAKQHYFQEPGRDRFPDSSSRTDSFDSPPGPMGKSKAPQRRTDIQNMPSKATTWNPWKLWNPRHRSAAETTADFQHNAGFSAAPSSLIISIFGKRYGRTAQRYPVSAHESLHSDFISKQICNYVYTEPRKSSVSHTTRERKNELKENIIKSRSWFLHDMLFLLNCYWGVGQGELGCFTPHAVLPVRKKSMTSGLQPLTVSFFNHKMGRVSCIPHWVLEMIKWC